MYRGASSTMPQKANPISAELTTGFGVTAQRRRPRWFARDGGRPRAGSGEWQIEWHALPTTLTSTAGALRIGRQFGGGLRVFPDRMRVNLAPMAAGHGRAYMITLAGAWAGTAHTSCSTPAVRESRETDRPLLATFESTLAPETWAAIAAAPAHRGRLPRVGVPDLRGGGRGMAGRRLHIDGSTSDRKRDADMTGLTRAGTAELTAMRRIRAFEERGARVERAKQVIGSVPPLPSARSHRGRRVRGAPGTDVVLATYRGHGWRWRVRTDGRCVRRTASPSHRTQRRSGRLRLLPPREAQIYGANSIVAGGLPMAGRRRAGHAVRPVRRVVVSRSATDATNQGGVPRGR